MGFVSRNRCNYDYHVSFSQDDIARGKVYNNYELRGHLGEKLSGPSVFYKTLAATSSTPTARRVAATNWSLGRIGIWTSPHTAATKRALGKT